MYRSSFARQTLFGDPRAFPGFVAAAVSAAPFALGRVALRPGSPIPATGLARLMSKAASVMPARDSRNVLQSESGSAAAALQKLTHRRSTPEIHGSVLECAAPGDAFAFNFWFSNERPRSFLN